MVKVLKVLIIFLILTGFINIAQAATVHGTIYIWSDFEKPMRNAIVEINSVPVQSKVATDGTYSFDNLSPGNYTIKAKYYRNNILDYIADEQVQIIDREGNFNIDLLLFPPTDPEIEYLGDMNLTNDLEIKNENDLNTYISIIFVLILLSSGFIIYWIKKKRTLHDEQVVAEPLAPPPMLTTNDKELPEDLRNLYDIILKAGGRTTQKELRKKLTCSEAKVSLMLDDLENRGLIKKIKKGRSNIIIAETRKI